MLLAPTFPREGFRPGDDEFARLLAPELEPDLVLDVVGRNWTRMVKQPDHPDRPSDVEARAWFARGEPEFVVVGIGDEEIEVWPSGPDLQYCNVDRQERRVALIPRGMRSGGLLRVVVSAIDDTATREKAERTWCHQCGRFTASAREGDDGLCFDCSYTWRRGAVF